jgi:lipopolysaccharide export system permease protein
LPHSFIKDIYPLRKNLTVIKKLDKLIILAFIGPFIATFFITLFVLVLQVFWLYIDDMVGKGLDFITVGRFILYVAATLVPLALPLAVLLSSIMTFGSLGETFELVAIKSAGISLLRFMRPLFIVTILICGVAFLFNNYIIPVAQLKMQTLKYDIIIAKPAFDIKEGVFYDKIEGYVIKIGKKEKDDSTIRNIIIYEQNYNLQDNMIIANKGKMKVTNNNFLEFDLQNGWMYQERGNHLSTNTEFIRIGFKEYKKVLDLSSFKLSRSDENQFKGNYQMLNMQQLGKNIDSLKRSDTAYLSKNERELNPFINFLKYKDSNWNAIKIPEINKASSILNLLPDSVRRSIIEHAISVSNSVRTLQEPSAITYENEQKDLRLHLIAWHDKVTMSIICLVLFLIGAPLGSIIRKGGIGLPLIFAVIFFVVFFLLNGYGEKFAKQEVLKPYAGKWLATISLLPIGIFLTYKALNDSQLFNKEFYFRIIRRFRSAEEKSSKA